MADYVKVEDGRGRNGFRWGWPDAEPALAVGEYLIVDCATQTAWVVQDANNADDDDAR